MQDGSLTIQAIFRHGVWAHETSVVATYDGQSTTARPYADIGPRVRQLADGLAALGVRPDDRVATLCWNHAEHVEAYFAVPCMGAVLLTLNLRLVTEQLRHIATHAEAKVLIVDGSLLELAQMFVRDVPSLKHVIVIGSGEIDDVPCHGYEQVLASATRAVSWPEIDERAAATLCYTTGTTGAPKGVLYSHRSTYLHSLATCSGNAFALSERDRVLTVVPMFHANAWGLPYAAWFMGADLLMPREFLQGEHLARIVENERATFLAGVPTVADDILRRAGERGRDLSSLRLVICGGSAVPPSLIERWHDQAGVEVIQGWGMTETSPLAAIARAPKDAAPGDERRWHAKTGRPIHGVELRVVDDTGAEAPRDAKTVGELQVRGPWITRTYYREDAPDKFDSGWLRTGDVGSIDDHGFVQITDRTKDVIKSGGEWISSVELENALMGHPQVLEAAVIGVPDDRWQERPLACVVLGAEADVSIEALRTHLAARVARWWLPERWSILGEIPKTSVGKFDKKTLREKYESGALQVVHLDCKSETSPTS
jgi:fatty-acyl-CoA synthase